MISPLQLLRSRTRQEFRQPTWPKVLATSATTESRDSINPQSVRESSASAFCRGAKHVMRNAYNNGTDWGDNEPLYGGFNNDNHRSTHPHWPLMQDKRGEMSIGSFGSAHGNGVNFVLADGSVHQVSYTIDSQVYRYLGNRHDGQPVEVSP